MAAAALSMASPKKDVIFYFLQASLEKVQHILYLHDNLKETLLHLNANVNLWSIVFIMSASIYADIVPSLWKVQWGDRNTQPEV